MEDLLQMTMCAPLYQIGVLLLLSTAALLSGKPRTGLLVNYLFILYWTYVFDREFVIKTGTEHFPNFPWIYFGFGFSIMFLAALGFLVGKK